MSTRKVMDATNLETNELIYFKGHAQATYMSNGKNIEEAFSDKQDNLMSGTNIKTINGNTIMGSGNLNTEYSVITVSSSSINMQPNTYYRVITRQSSLTITFQNPTYSNIVNEYVIEFICGGTVSVPSTVVWASGKVPTFEVGKTYLLSVVNNLGLVAKFE